VLLHFISSTQIGKHVNICLSHFRRGLKTFLLRQSYSSVFSFSSLPCGPCGFYLGHVKKFQCNVMFTRSAVNMKPLISSNIQQMCSHQQIQVNSNETVAIHG